MHKQEEEARRQTGSSNTYKIGNAYYFLELSNREHRDGSITGKIMLVTSGNPICDEVTYAEPAGSFRIDGETGKLTRGPKWLREISE